MQIIRDDEGLTHRLVREQDRRLAWKSGGACSQKQWLAEHCRMTLGQAGSQTTTARRLEALPQTAAALADGTIGAEHARVAAEAVRDLSGEAAAGLDRLVAGPVGLWILAACGRPWTTTRTGCGRRRWPSGSGGPGRRGG